MVWPRQKQSQLPVALSLDIGTEFAKVLVFEVSEDKALVIGHARERQRLSDMHGGGVTDIAGVITTCSKAIRAATEMAGRTPEQVVMGIAGELVKGSTTTTSHVRKTANLPITEAELKEIISKAQQETLTKSRRDLSWETGYAEIDVELVNSAVVAVKIDGYRVNNPIGFQGRQVEVSIYTSYAPIVHLGALQSIGDELGLEILSIATEPYAVARCFGDDMADTSSIFIDVGGGTTDIAVVRSGGLEGTKMFALGGRVITKRIATAQKVSFTEAEQIKLAYVAGNLEEEDAIRVKQYLEDDVSVWLSGVELALEEFTQSERFIDNRLLPSKIYLCGGGSMLPDLKEALEAHDWGSVLPFARQPDVQFIRPQDVANVRDTTNDLVGVQDVTPMALANIGIDLVREPSRTRGALSRIFKGMRS